VANADPDSTGLNPAWRKALIHVVWGTGWDEGTSTSEIKQLRAALSESLKNLTHLVGSSAYFNEVRWEILVERTEILISASRHPCSSRIHSTHSSVIIMTN
jgi:hypothetical protein